MKKVALYLLVVVSLLVGVLADVVDKDTIITLTLEPEKSELLSGDKIMIKENTEEVLILKAKQVKLNNKATPPPVYSLDLVFNILGEAVFVTDKKLNKNLLYSTPQSISPFTNYKVSDGVGNNFQLTDVWKNSKSPPPVLKSGDSIAKIKVKMKPWNNNIDLSLENAMSKIGIGTVLGGDKLATISMPTISLISAKCLVNGECKQGEFCGLGICTDGTKDKTCDSKADCKSKICFNNKCSDGGRNDACTDNTNCAPGNYCVDQSGFKSCQTGDPGSSCNKEAECDQGNHCVNNQCSKGEKGDPCSADSHCDSGFYCVANQCSAGETNDQCIDGKDCDSGKCTSNLCEEDKTDNDGDGVIDSKENPKCVAKDLVKGVKRVFPANKGYPTASVGCLWGDFNYDGVLCADDHSKYLDMYLTVFNKQLAGDKVQFDLSKDGNFDANDHSRYLDNYLNEFAKFVQKCKS